MKTRFLIFLAAMLLGSASAFAQSGNNEPMKGDVNGDGKVDVADITAVIKIMKDGGGTSEETKQYWYVGFGDLPTSVSNIKTSASETGWHYFTAGTTELHVGPLSNDTKVYWFVLVPENSGLENVVDAGEVLGGYTNSTVTIGGTSYTKITQDDASKKFDYVIKRGTEPVTYFSVGTTPITISNYTTANNATTDIPTTKEFTNNSGSKSSVYVLAPSNKTVTIKDTNMNIEFTDVYEDTSVTIPNHKVWTKSSKVGNGGSITVILK